MRVAIIAFACALIACKGPTEAPPRVVAIPAPRATSPPPSAPTSIASSAPGTASSASMPSMPSMRIESAIGGGLAPYQFIASGDVDTEKFQIVITALGKSQTIFWEPDACPTCGQVGVSKDLVRIVDLNFDGYNDLLLEWSILKTDQICYEAHLFLPAKGLFDAEAIPDPDHPTSSLTLCGADGPIVDPKRRVIHTIAGHATCCEVTIWTSTWAWKTGKLVQIAQTEKTTPNPQ